MLDSFAAFSLTTLMIVVGPLLLGLAIAYGVYRTGQRSRSVKQHTEAASKEVYRHGAKQERKGEEPHSR